MRAAPLPFASVLKENLNKDLNPMVDEQNVCREVKYRQIAVTHRLVDVNESRFIRSCSFVSACFPQSVFYALSLNYFPATSQSAFVQYLAYVEFPADCLWNRMRRN